MDILHILLIFMAIHSGAPQPNEKPFDRIPRPPVNLNDFLIADDFQKYAERYMNRKRLSYIQTGAMLEQTLKDNTDAFLRIRLLPKLLRNTLKIDLSTTVLGQHIPFPIGFCPNAIQEVVNPEAENATARAALAEKTVMILSAHSSNSIEEVADSVHRGGIRWYQVLSYKNLSITEDLVRRARRAGYKAIVLTADYPVTGLRITDMKAKFNGEEYRHGNFEKYSNSEDFEGSIQPDPATTWTIIKHLKTVSRLPLVIKGILTAEDAKLAVENGADAIIVSNHGARQLDGVPAAIDALPEVVKAVNGRVEVYTDSGVRTGSDVVKALALGARAVFIGRPNLYGLYAAGVHGSRKVLNILKDELVNSMHLIGATKPSHLDQSYIRRTSVC